MTKLLIALFFMSFVANLASAKDLVSFPYEGKKSDFAVGFLGGTGCTRHWDFLDFKDFHPSAPADRCGQYVLVSPRHHKWVDTKIYGNDVTWWKAWPIKGDGILEKAKCDIDASPGIYILKQHISCGDQGNTIALCDEAGNDVSLVLGKSCH